MLRGAKVGYTWASEGCNKGLEEAVRDTSDHTVYGCS